MKMRRQWMYDDQCSSQFIDGMHTFLIVAQENKRADGFMPCPCAGCKNGHNYSNSRIIHVTCLSLVSCPTIMFGPSTEKEGL